MRERERKEWEQERDGQMDRQTVAGMGRKRRRRGIGGGRKDGATDSSKDAERNIIIRDRLPYRSRERQSVADMGRERQKRDGEKRGGWTDRQTAVEMGRRGVDRQIDRQQ